MRTFTYAHRVVVPGLHVIKDSKYGDIVHLGAKGRGCRYEKIGMDRKKPPVIKEQSTESGGKVRIVRSAFPRTIRTRSEDEASNEFVVLSKPFKGNKKILLRICTTEHEGPTLRDGTYETASGEPRTAVKTHGAYPVNNSKRMVKYCDDLVILRPGDAVRVMPMYGDSYEDDFIVENDNGKVKAVIARDWQPTELAETSDTESEAPPDDPTAGLKPVIDMRASKKEEDTAPDAEESTASTDTPEEGDAGTAPEESKDDSEEKTEATTA